MRYYQDVMQAIRDGVDAETVEAMITDEHTNITAAQMADLREELRVRDEAEA